MSIYDESAYRQFAQNLKHALSGPNIKHCKLKELRKPSIQTGTKTKFGSWGWRSAISSRIAPKTVYLGSKEVVLPNPTQVQENIITAAPEELHKVLQLLRTLPMVHLRRQMGDNDEYNPICNLYISVADHKNYRLAYMWGSTMGDPVKGKPGPEFTMIHIPEEHQLRQQVLAIPEHHINIALGTDYMGENKKGFLRQAMWYADEHNMLGLHAGSKMVTARDAHDGKLKKYGVLLFGLTATGKSTWSCHQLGLNEDDGERTDAIQDDIVFLRKDGSAYGSEQNFFVKTDVDSKLQEAMYQSLTDKSALYENVMIDADGNPDFLDEKLCANGRAVTRKDKLRVKRGRKLVRIDYKGLNLPTLDEFDCLTFAFITRRNTIMSFAQELTAEEAILAYLWGESTHSYASQPAKAGESTRIVGTDPFIVGSRARKVNRFKNIIMDLSERYPGKLRFYQYNTGGMGEIIEMIDTPQGKKKKLVRKVMRVPIPLMAAIQRGDLRGTNTYEKGLLGVKRIVKVEGFDLSEYDPKNLYDNAQINAYIDDLVSGRRKFTEEITQEGLDKEIIKWAEKSYKISKSTGKDIWPVNIPKSLEKIDSLEIGIPATVGSDNGDSIYRPPRSLGWRVK
ncbi:MAG: phosphoenolpyruvate carboxykinase (ATP) [Candidatus Hatepunaea meridiana]|nr:phosphoenolpyruvate carboxykinase (ATP) [Candidatus Hatepunaea meridiana]